MINITRIAVYFCILIFIPFFSKGAVAEPLRAVAAVERSSVFVGESFVFQIQVSGSENPERPDLSNISGFNVEFKGGRQNSSRSVTIINGRVTQNVRQGYFFSYQLTPRGTGRLTIPSITVRAGGKIARTRPVAIHVQKPVETDDFKLRLHLSKQNCYVGEPVTLTFTWYLGKDVRGFKFNLPLLENDSFHFVDPKIDTRSGKQYYRIPLGGGQVIGEKGRGRLGGREYATISFKKVLIPTQPENVTIEPATVVCQALAGYQRRRSPFGDDFFSDFFKDDFFGRGRRGVYRKVIVPSNSLSLRVSGLPTEGRPKNFAGHVGEYRIEATATPTDVSIGDPITLKIILSGPDYLEHINLPPLAKQQALIRNFKIPEERAEGETLETSKVFTQTIRALRVDVTKIPPIELSYFDTGTGKYQVARTGPIPLTVNPARIVTALDAEGASAPVSKKKGVETWTRGIAYNYEDMSVIEKQRFGPVSWLKSPQWLCLIGIPPFLYFILFAGNIIIRRRSADPLASRARKAYGKMAGTLKKARRADSAQKSCEIILDAFRNYLGDKLRISSGAITFGDVGNILLEKGVAPEILDDLKLLFEQCEAGRYAGTSGPSDPAALVERSLSLARNLEKKLK